MKRYELVDYQRYLGEAIAEIAMAEAAVIQGAQQWMELARQNVEEDRPFTAEDDARLEALQATACRIALARRRGHPLPHRRLGGRARRPAHAALLARHVDVLEPQHAGPARLPAHEPRAPPPRAADRAAGPGPGGELDRPARRARRRCRAARPRGRRRRATSSSALEVAVAVLVREVAGEDEHARSPRASRPAARPARDRPAAAPARSSARTWRRTYSDGRSLTHGTSRQTAFQSLSKRHSSGGSHEKPHSSRHDAQRRDALEDALGDEAEDLRLGDDLRVAQVVLEVGVGEAARGRRAAGAAPGVQGEHEVRGGDRLVELGGSGGCPSGVSLRIGQQHPTKPSCAADALDLLDGGVGVERRDVRYARRRSSRSSHSARSQSLIALHSAAS